MFSADVVARFWKKVDKSAGPDGCWLWITKNGTAAKPSFSLDGRTFHAEKVAFMITKGMVPDGLMVRHTCVNMHCVNPKHLVAATRATFFKQSPSIARYTRSAPREFNETRFF